MPDNLNEILAQQLRDVHLPEAVGWWPLAFGWWIIIGLGIVGVSALIVFYLRKRRGNRYRKLALYELQSCYAAWQDDQDAETYLQSANAILKRSVLAFDPSSSLVAVSGQQWIDALNEYAKTALPPATQTALAIECYRPGPGADINQVHRHLAAWLKSHRHNRQPEQRWQHA